jgi:hypothetical protein
VQCVATSARIASRIPDSVLGPPAQATSAAVGGAYAALAATGAALAARVDATSAKLSAAGSRYVTQDEDSAHRLAVLGGPVEV